jgi:hypothetical protein
MIKMTYLELIGLALKNYHRGGDVIVECWSENDFNDYCAEFGSMTEEKAFALFRLYHMTSW